MILEIVSQMLENITTMKEIIVKDIEDVKLANHINLLQRNDIKQELMEKLVEQKKDLNNELVKVLKKGEDVNIYRDNVNNLENELKELFDLNRKLGSIVLPVKQMYKDIVDEIAMQNGGNIVEIKA